VNAFPIRTVWMTGFWSRKTHKNRFQGASPCIIPVAQHPSRMEWLYSKIPNSPMYITLWGAPQIRRLFQLISNRENSSRLTQLSIWTQRRIISKWATKRGMSLNPTTLVAICHQTEEERTLTTPFLRETVSMKTTQFCNLIQAHQTRGNISKTCILALTRIYPQ